MNRTAKNRAHQIQAGVALALIVAMPDMAWHARGQGAKTSGPHTAGVSRTATGAAFRTGEKLEYTVSWAGAPAATAELEIMERRAFYRREAWHFKVVAHTVEAVRFFYPLDDQFDSYTDTATLASMRYEIYIREKDKKQEAVIRMGSENDPVQEGGPSVRVLPGTRDPLGFVYFLRTVDWPRVKQNSTPVYDGKKLYELRAKLVSDQESVSVPAGSYAATKIELRTYEKEHEVSNARFWIWLAQDVERTPILMEAELPFGNLRVELKRKN